MSNRELNTSPMFIVGNPRSGTTMLRLMLSCHPNIGIPPEGGFTVRLGWKYETLPFGRNVTRRQFVEDFLAIDTAADWGFTNADLLTVLDNADPKSYSDALYSIYAAYLKKVFPGKYRWGDKTTWFSNHILKLVEYFPDAQFVHIVRDGRDVAVSYREVPHLTSKIRKIARIWATNYECIRRASIKLDSTKMYMLTYEHLVQDPKMQLKKLCDYLNEEFCPEMLDFWRVNRERELEPMRHMPWKMNTRIPVTRKSVGRWKMELSHSEVRAFELVAGHVLVKLRYGLSIENSRAAMTYYRYRLAIFMIVERIFLFARRAKARYL